MSTQKFINLALRAAAVVVCLATIWLLWTRHLSTGGSLLVAVVCVGLGRMYFRAKSVAEPRGDERDFAVRPVLWNILKSVGCFVAALVWAAAGGLAVRYGVLPDTELVAYGLIAAPLLGLLLLGAVFLGRAMSSATFGNSSR
jgi:hypothetical protein